MNKEQFLKTEFGGELESTITAWDDALSRNREDTVDSSRCRKLADIEKGN